MTRTAIDKRDHADPPRVEVLEEAKGPAMPAGRMLISSPLELDAVIRRIPEGRVVTLGTLRANLARSRHADYTCPLTTGIFLRIVAEAAEEERAAGGGRITPYWRVVRDDGTLIDKLPGGTAAQARRLAVDGVEVLHLGKVPRLLDVDHWAWTPPLLGKGGKGGKGGKSGKVGGPRKPQRPTR